ncbi:MAG TPA: SDR family oxidoreductase [Burkholderiaceae bacterium]|nr:SDR family oxidoreductase [Burkholderiaceae bacterium]
MKVWLVTGGATGIGRATALALAAPGDAVVVNYARSADAARETAAECERRGARALAVAADVSRDEDCRALAAAVRDAFGRLDGLVNNAGTTRFAPAGDLEAVNAEDFAAIYAVNVVGTWQATRACADLLRASRGAVVNVSSASALDGTGSSPAYSASKAALNNLTITLARALAPEVRVNAVCPGFVETDWHVRGLGRERFDAVRESVSKATALRSTLSAEDVAESIVWMLGQPKMTGQNVLIDAGRQVGAGFSLMPRR